MHYLRPIEHNDIDEVFKHACQIATINGTISPDFVLTKEKLVEGLFTNQDDLYGLVAIEDDEIIGSSIYCFTNTNRAFNNTGCLFLDLLFVASDYRRKKVGEMLMHELIKIAKAKKLSRIEFWCMKDNLFSNAFYKSMGAEVVDLLNVYNLAI